MLEQIKSLVPGVPGTQEAPSILSGQAAQSQLGVGVRNRGWKALCSDTGFIAAFQRKLGLGSKRKLSSSMLHFLKFTASITPSALIAQPSRLSRWRQGMEKTPRALL